MIRSKISVHGGSSSLDSGNNASGQSDHCGPRVQALEGRGKRVCVCVCASQPVKHGTHTPTKDRNLEAPSPWIT